jgi:predicted metal-binding membrane protein
MVVAAAGRSEGWVRISGLTDNVRSSGHLAVPRPDLVHLGGVDAAVGQAFRSPRRVALVALIALTGAGWAYLALLVALHAGQGAAATLGPGMGLFDRLVAGDLDPLGRALWETLCRPAFGVTGIDPAGFALLAVMWMAMVLAMMLPTAGPMILTYAEIADTAAAKGEPIVSPLVILAGYLVVWLAAAFGFAALQTGLIALSLADPAMVAAGPLLAGAIFLVAGLWQLSPAKHACVTQCQRPMPYFFSNWTTRPGGVFRLGLRQGLFCLGCCWAMMLVMLAVGTMNVVWMALLGVVMTVEKLATSARFARIVGGVCLGTGAALVLFAVVRHLPA